VPERKKERKKEVEIQLERKGVSTIEENKNNIRNVKGIHTL
jgi:hypothetical protein